MGKILDHKRERKPVLPPQPVAVKKPPTPKKQKSPALDKPKAKPSMAFIRLCRWLEGGSCLPNLKKMAIALNLKGFKGSDGVKEVLIARIVEVCRILLIVCLFVQSSL